MAGKHRGEYRDESEYGDGVSFGEVEYLDDLDVSAPVEPEPRERPAGRGRKLVVGGVVAALVGGIAVGGVAVGMFLSGGGTQPEDVLPAGTVAFVRIDLDPSAGQKLNAMRLLDKFPTLDTSGDDLKATLLEDMFDDNPFGMTYDQDIAPWIGDRAAVALLPAPDTEEGVTPAFVVEFTDEAKMRAALDKINAEATQGDDGWSGYVACQEAEGSVTAGEPGVAAPGTVASAGPASSSSAVQDPCADLEPPDYSSHQTDFAYAVRDGYVFLGEEQGVLDDAVTAATVLADDATFAADKEAIDGEDQIALAWADLTDVYGLVPRDEKQEFTELFGDMSDSGSIVVGAHVEPDHIEATGKLRGFTPAVPGITVGTHPGTELVRGLPADVIGAASLTGLGPALAELWEEYESSDFLDLKPAAEEMDLRLPEDLVAVFGDEFAVGVAAVDGYDVAVRVRTDDPDRAQAAITPLLQLGGEPEVRTAPADGGYAFATDPDMLDAAAGGTGGLGENPVFTTAVPGAADATGLLYLNLSDLFASFEVDEPDLRPLSALGIATFGDSGEISFTARLTTR